MAKRYGLDPGEVRQDPPAQGMGSLAQAPRRAIRRLQNLGERLRTAGKIQDPAEKFTVDLGKKVLEVWDGQDPSVRRVQMGILRDAQGNYTSTDYGLKIWDSTGALLLDESGVTVVRPILTVDQTQSGSTGTVSVNVEDPHLVVTALEFSKKPDGGTYGAWASTWDTSTGVAGTDTTLERTEGVALAGKHNVGVKVRLQWTEDGQSQEEIVPLTFDEDTSAEVQSVVLNWDSTNVIKGYVIGDEDCDNIYLNVRAGSDPGAPTSGSKDATVSGRYGSFTSAWTAQVGEAVYVNARGYNGTDPGPNRLFIFRRGDAPFVPFHVEIGRTQSGTTGTLTLDIDDPTKCITAIQFQKKEGTTDFGGSWLSSWDSSTGTPGSSTTLQRVESLTLQPKHDSAIKFQVTYKDSSNNTRYHEDVVSFDSDLIAELVSAEFAVDEDGNLTCTVQGDEDTAQIILNIVVNGAYVAVTQANKDVSFSLQRGQGDTGVDLAWGDYAYISVGACPTVGAAPDTIARHFIRRDVGEIYKTVRLSPTGLAISRSSGVGIFGRDGGIIPAATGSSSWEMSLDKVPDGVTIDNIDIRYYRSTSSDLINSITLYKVNSSGSLSTVYQWTSFPTTGSYATVSWTGDETIDMSTYNYFFLVSFSAASSVNDVRILFFEITYVSHDIDETL